MKKTKIGTKDKNNVNKKIEEKFFEILCLLFPIKNIILSVVPKFIIKDKKVILRIIKA